jgi:glucose dehydrogenase
VADPAVQLQRLYLAGFDLQTFDRFPKCVGVVRDDCIALLVPTPEGLQMLGTPGWRMGETIGVLVERDGRQVFQAKSDIVEATQERLDTLRRFRSELGVLLAA